MFDWGSSTRVVHGSIVPDDTPAIDAVLDEGTVSKIYQNWDSEQYGDPVDYGGEVQAITVKMVYDAGEDFLMSLPRIGARKTEEIMMALGEVVKEVPYLA